MLKQEGQTGTTKPTQYTRYLTIGLAIPQSTTPVATPDARQLFQNHGGPVPDDSIQTVQTMVITAIAKTGLIRWLGELVTERGVGNGMSPLIFTSIAAGVPRPIGRSGVQGVDMLT
jgi:preprotein translocase subunit SecY